MKIKIALFLLAAVAAAPAQAQKQLSVGEICEINKDVEKSIALAGKHVVVVGKTFGSAASHYIDFWEWGFQKAWTDEKGVSHSAAYEAVGCHITAVEPDAMMHKLVQPHLKGEPEPAPSYYWTDLSSVYLLEIAGVLEIDPHPPDPHSGGLLLYIEKANTTYDPKGIREQ